MTDSERIAELEKQVKELRQLVDDLLARPVVIQQAVPDWLQPPYKIT